jgi:Chaperone of endosialidase
LVTRRSLATPIANGNTATGFQALFNNTTGDSNTALGISAGSGVTTGTNVICIGSDGANVNNSCFIGNIRGVTTATNDAIPVVIDSAGQLGTMSSSYRFKKDIATMEKSSEAILSLRPVKFHYKTDTKSTPQFGLIAEEVAKVNPDLVVRDNKGEIYAVRYDAVNAMLLNEFLREHRKIQELEATVAKQQKDFQATATHQQKQIEALTAGLQKVSVQLEASKPAPQTVANK